VEVKLKGAKVNNISRLFQNKSTFQIYANIHIAKLPLLPFQLYDLATKMGHSEIMGICNHKAH